MAPDIPAAATATPARPPRAITENRPVTTGIPGHAPTIRPTCHGDRLLGIRLAGSTPKANYKEVRPRTPSVLAAAIAQGTVVAY